MILQYCQLLPAILKGFHGKDLSYYYVLMEKISHIEFSWGCLLLEIDLGSVFGGAERDDTAA